MLDQFTIIDKIQSDSGIALYRAYQKNERVPILLKILESDHPQLLEIARLEQEFALLKKLSSIKGLPKVLKLLKKSDLAGLVLEDSVEQTLQKRLLDGPLKWDEFLRIAISLATIVGELNQHLVIHKDIKPANILVGHDLSTVKIINFNYATLLTNEIQTAISPELLEGTLAYMSPEQTGRMGRPIDYRSDLYSLGVTFYEMLTGKLPFEGEDPLSLVHAHIAKLPLPPYEYNHKIPKVLSDIVMKLMSKAAEDRYQSAYGLVVDLTNCLDQLNRKGEIQPFVLAKQDVPSTFHISRKLYGRELETEKLQQAFDQVKRGKSGLLLVSGPAGIGKSALIQQAHKVLVETRGIYCEGKFDQLRQVPNVEWSQAFGSLIRQILTEDAQSIAEWQKKLKAALKKEAQVIVDIIPELEFLIGKQPPVTNLSASDSRNRFYRVFKEFIQVFADETHPLVIFLDDLQWAGLTSLEFLVQLLTQFDLKYVLIIGAYREEKMTQYPLLTTALAKIGETIPINKIILSPMREQDIQQLLEDSLYSKDQKIKSLAKICYEKTSGNPFFLLQFLEVLYSDHLIFFKPESGKWDWNLKKIQEKESTDNVIDFMVDRIDKLPIETKQMLQSAACVGSKFDSSTLAAIYKKMPEEIVEILWPALEKEYIRPLDDSYKYIKTIPDLRVNFQFVHDRVQQSAYSTLDQTQKKKTHFIIGKTLLRHQAKKDNNVFDVVNQFNFAIDLLKTKQLKEKIATLNLIAAEKSKKANAFQFAFDYSITGLNLLETDTWEDKRKLMLEMNLQAAEAAYLVGNYELSHKLTDFIINSAFRFGDKLKAYEIKITSYILNGKIDTALDIGLKALGDLGINLPRKPGKKELFFAVMQLQILTYKKGLSELSKLPTITDDHKLAIMSMLFKVSFSAFFIEPDLFGLIGLKLAILSIRYGNSVFSSMGYSLCVAIFTVLNNFEKAELFSNLAFYLCEKYNTSAEKCIISLLIGTVYYPRRYHLNKARRILWETFQIGLDSIFLEFAWSALSAYVLYSYLSGKNLTQLIKMVKKYYNFATEHKVHVQKHFLEYYVVFLIQLQLGNFCPITEKIWYSRFLEAKEHFKKINNRLALTEICIHESYQRFLFENYEVALQFLQEVNVEDVKFLYSRSIYHLTDSLTQLAIYPTASKNAQKKIISRVKSNKRVLMKWSKNGSINFINKYYLVEAELQRVMGHQEKASQCYNQAIFHAQKNGYIQEEALANELAGKYYLSLGLKKFAKVYFTDAHYCYTKWGSFGKADQLKSNYHEFLATEILNESNKDISISSKSLDLETILKSTQVITGEVILHKLVSKILHVMLQNMGADKCTLLLEKNHQLYIEGEYFESGKQKNILGSQPLASSKLLPKSIIDYVQRTHQFLVLNDVVNESPYNKDNYILQEKPKSILCAPIVSHQSFLGILYFENKLTTNAFTSDRLDVLTPLSVQIAISIENARLYQAIERFVPKEFLMLLDRRNLVDVQLGDAIQKVLSILFMDIKGYTTLSEKLLPIDVFQFINTYLSYMEPIIASHQGFIDKYLGDGIMALFPNNADEAVGAAVGLQEAVAEYNRQIVTYSEQAISARIGINTGAVMLGTVGTSHRLDGSVISDAVNTASRIMDVNRIYGTNILIGEATYNALENPQNYKLRRIDKIKLKGKDEPTIIWEVLSNSSNPSIPSQDMIELFEKAWSYYYEGKFKSAQKLFLSYLEKFPDDQASKFFVKRCEDFIKNGYPEGWDGVTKF